MLHLSDLVTEKTAPSIQVSHDYLHNLNLTVKHLTRLLTIRLRTEFPESYAILCELNERMIPLIQSSTKVLQHNQQHLKTQVKDQELESRLIDLETAYSQQIKQLTKENNQLIDDLTAHREKVITFSALLRDSQELLTKLQQKNEYLQEQININQAETNKLNQEKESMKRQLNQLQLLIKQVSQEKSVNDVDAKLNLFKQEMENLKMEYQRNLDEKEDKIVSQQRELDLAQKELNLNSEFQELAQSLQNSSNKKTSDKKKPKLK